MSPTKIPHAKLGDFCVFLRHFPNFSIRIYSSNSPGISPKTIDKQKTIAYRIYVSDILKPWEVRHSGKHHMV